jgi:ElaB/YqjD/DUF883 family membrane-anchored ribosome-binding protein
VNTTTKKDQTGAQTEKAREEANTAVDKVKEAATHSGQAVSSAASAVGHKADDLTASAGSGARSLADTVRQQGPSEGMLGRASRAVADTLEQGGKYLEENKLSGMADDFGEMIRRNPLPAVLIGIGIGFLLGRAMRS